MHKQNKLSGPALYGRNVTYTGFTIVELLIVIVVIAILAAISIVAYMGIQNRANDAVVKSDLANLTKKIEEYRALEGGFPAANSATAPVMLDAVRGLKVTRGAYGNHYTVPEGIFAGEYNIIYCTSSDGRQYGFAAWSKSGRGFALMSGTVRDFNYAAAGAAVTCPRLVSPWGSGSNFWFYDASTWRPFI